VVDGESEEVDGRSVVHGARSDVEGEALDLAREEDAEIVTEVSADETKTDVSAENESATPEKEDESNDINDIKITALELDDGLEAEAWEIEEGLDVEHTLERGEAGLLGDHLVVDVVTSETDGEDDDAVEDASGLVVAAEEAGEELSLVLETGDDVPHERVEEDVEEHGVDHGVLEVHAFLDLLPAEVLAGLVKVIHCSQTTINTEYV